jgi:hypothetical protein
MGVIPQTRKARILKAFLFETAIKSEESEQKTSLARPLATSPS